MKEKKEIDLESFASDYRAGMNINALKNKYSIGWTRAQQIAKEIGTSAANDAADPAEEDEQENLSISLEFPRSRTLEFLSAFPPDEIIAALADFDEPSQAMIIQFVMQRRLNRELSPTINAVAMPQLVATA